MTAEMKLFSNCLKFFCSATEKLDILGPPARDRSQLKYPCNFMHYLTF
jgi:hypothetical protein